MAKSKRRNRRSRSGREEEGGAVQTLNKARREKLEEQLKEIRARGPRMSPDESDTEPEPDSDHQSQAVVPAPRRRISRDDTAEFDPRLPLDPPRKSLRRSQIQASHAMARQMVEAMLIQRAQNQHRPPQLTLPSISDSNTMVANNNSYVPSQARMKQSLVTEESTTDESDSENFTMVDIKRLAAKRRAYNWERQRRKAQKEDEDIRHKRIDVDFDAMESDNILNMLRNKYKKDGTTKGVKTTARPPSAGGKVRKNKSRRRRNMNDTEATEALNNAAMNANRKAPEEEQREDPYVMSAHEGAKRRSSKQTKKRKQLENGNVEEHIQTEIRISTTESMEQVINSGDKRLSSRRRRERSVVDVVDETLTYTPSRVQSDQEEAPQILQINHSQPQPGRSKRRRNKQKRHSITQGELADQLARSIHSKYQDDNRAGYLDPLPSAKGNSKRRRNRRKGSIQDQINLYRSYQEGISSLQYSKGPLQPVSFSTNDTDPYKPNESGYVPSFTKRHSYPGDVHRELTILDSIMKGRGNKSGLGKSGFPEEDNYSSQEHLPLTGSSLNFQEPLKTPRSMLNGKLYNDTAGQKSGEDRDSVPVKLASLPPGEGGDNGNISPDKSIRRAVSHENMSDKQPMRSTSKFLNPEEKNTGIERRGSFSGDHLADELWLKHMEMGNESDSSYNKSKGGVGMQRNKSPDGSKMQHGNHVRFESPIIKQTLNKPTLPAIRDNSPVDMHTNNVEAMNDGMRELAVSNNHREVDQDVSTEYAQSIAATVDSNSIRDHSIFTDNDHSHTNSVVSQAMELPQVLAPIKDTLQNVLRPGNDKFYTSTDEFEDDAHSELEELSESENEADTVAPLPTCRPPTRFEEAAIKNKEMIQEVRAERKEMKADLEMAMKRLDDLQHNISILNIEIKREMEDKTKMQEKLLKMVNQEEYLNEQEKKHMERLDELGKQDQERKKTKSKGELKLERIVMEHEKLKLIVEELETRNSDVEARYNELKDGEDEKSKTMRKLEPKIKAAKEEVQRLEVEKVKLQARLKRLVRGRGNEVPINNTHGNRITQVAENPSTSGDTESETDGDNQAAKQHVVNVKSCACAIM